MQERQVKPSALRELFRGPYNSHTSGKRDAADAVPDSSGISSFAAHAERHEHGGCAFVHVNVFVLDLA